MSSIAGERYWRSLDELAQTPEFQEAVRREFPDDEWDRLPPATRRQFVKVMGASLALAGLTACRWPKERIVPFASRPEGFVPGVPQRYATAFEVAGSALGMLVTSFDGRPIKAEGNPGHPDSLGALPAVAQASVLELYDPDRSRRLLERSSGGEFPRSWADFETAIAARCEAPGRGLAVLAESSSSPTLAWLRERFGRERPEARWYEYEAASRDAEREGLALAFGRPLRLDPRLESVRVLACFDADPLFDHPAAVRLARSFAERRVPAPDMLRLYVAEPAYTLTGGKADHRAAVAHGAVPATLAALAKSLVERHGVVLPDELATAVAAASAELPPGFLEHLASDLADHRGAGLILVGHRQPAAAHAFAALLNQALGNLGGPMRLLEVADPERPSHLAAITELAARMRAGEVETLLILGGNPAFDAPADLGFAELLGAVPFSAHLSLFNDETSRRSTWHLPRAHALEAWGDARAWDGTLTLAQPLIAPLYNGRSPLEVLASALGMTAPSGYDLVRARLAELRWPLDFETTWRTMLHDGVVHGSGAAEARPAADAAAAGLVAGALATTAPTLSAERPELLLTADPKVFDGRWANNGWLQELPEAITKITWDTALLASPWTVRELGLADGELAEVAAGGVTVALPVYVVPGMARHSLTVAFGQGREAAGRVGAGVGVNVYPLRRGEAPWSVAGATVRPTGRRHTLATTQDHHAIDMIGFSARNERVGVLVREATVGEFLAHPEVIRHVVHEMPIFSLWQDHQFEGDQWGMSVDLQACTGCNACVIACQAENNIPIVGREQVIRQREMHWIRVDRYFRTPAGVAPDEVEDAAMVFQPMACVHCEMAPCEQVCPVAATQHTPDGLNAMAYNRCIGTRYCSNNCPFKVRRFNYFNLQKGVAETTRMQYNPEVTVRSRGVMEKCSFCVQRIQNVGIAARNEQRPIRDGEILTACQQTCPSRAIVFGNLNDPDSEVARLRADQRSYATLAELNIRPRTLYMARISNPADGASAGAGGGAHHDDHGHGKG